MYTHFPSHFHRPNSSAVNGSCYLRPPSMFGTINDDTTQHREIQRGNNDSFRLTDRRAKNVSSQQLTHASGRVTNVLLTWRSASISAIFWPVWHVCLYICLLHTPKKPRHLSTKAEKTSKRSPRVAPRERCHTHTIPQNSNFCGKRKTHDIA